MCFLLCFSVFYMVLWLFLLFHYAFRLFVVVFYVGFMACPLLLSSFVLCFTWVLRGSFLVKSLFCYVFAVFYVGFMAFPSVPRAAQSRPEQHRAVQSSPEQPKSSPEPPRAAQSRPEQPKAVQSSPEQPGAAQSSPEQPRAARSSPEQPRAVRKLNWIVRFGQCLVLHVKTGSISQLKHDGFEQLSWTAGFVSFWCCMWKPYILSWKNVEWVRIVQGIDVHGSLSVIMLRILSIPSPLPRTSLSLEEWSYRYISYTFLIYSIYIS